MKELYLDLGKHRSDEPEQQTKSLNGEQGTIGGKVKF